MIVDILKTDLEQKLQRAKEGFTTLGEGASLFAFPERSMIRGEVIPFTPCEFAICATS